VRVRSPSPRGCAYSEHAFYSAGSAAWATGSRGTSREVGMMWAGAALRTATGRLIRHVSFLSHQMLMLARRAYTNYYPHHALSRSVELSEPPVSGVCGMRDHASTDQDVRLRVSRHEFSISIAYIQRERVSVPRHACVPHMTSRPSPNDYLFLLTMLPSERAAAEFCQDWNRAVSRTHNLRISHGTRQSHTLRARRAERRVGRAERRRLGRVVLHAEQQFMPDHAPRVP
jgi:hypothetical protein